MVIGNGGISSEYSSGLNQGGDCDHWYPNSEPIEPKSLLTWRTLDVGRSCAPRRHDMVIGAAVLVICDEQERLVPLGRGAHGCPDIQKELFSRYNIMGRVFVIRIIDETCSRNEYLGRVPLLQSPWKSSKWANRFSA